MDIKTCEEYVLAELEDYKRAAEQAERYAAQLAVLKEIFVVDVDPESETGELRIGIRNQVLDREHDVHARDRVALLQQLFMEQPVDPLAQLLASGAIQVDTQDPSATGDATGGEAREADAEAEAEAAQAAGEDAAEKEGPAGPM